MSYADSKGERELDSNKYVKWLLNNIENPEIQKPSQVL